MPTMRDLLDEARGDLPPSGLDIEAIAARGRRTIRRRRWTTAAGSAFLVAAIAAAGIAFVRPSAPPVATAEPSPAPSDTTETVTPTVASNLLMTTFGAYPVAGTLRVDAPSEVTTGYESAHVYRDSRRDTTGPLITAVGTLTAYRPGVFDPSGFRGGKTLTINGHQGYAATAIGGLELNNGASSTYTAKLRAVVAWEYSDDAWAVVESDQAADLSLDEARQVATAFPVASSKVIAGRRTRIPFTIADASLPPGYHLVAAGNTDTDAVKAGVLGALSRAVYARGTVPFTGLTTPYVIGPETPYAFGNRASFAISVERAGGARYTGQECRVDGGLAVCREPIAGTSYYLQVASATTELSADAVRGVIDSVTVADPNRAETWNLAR